MLNACRAWRVSPSVFASWSEDDQDEVIGFLHEEAVACGGCGTHPDEWENDRFAFVAESSHCPGCELLKQEERNLPEGVEGMKTFLVPREVAEARRAAAEEVGDGAERTG